MEKDEPKAKARSVALKGMPVPPDFPDDVDDMSSGDWTETEAWLAKSRAWFEDKAPAALSPPDKSPEEI